MSLKKVLLKNTTRMSLHERFTYLRSQPDPSVQVATYRQGLFSEQQASSRNRRLAYQMERRPAVMAALKLKKKSLRQRLGQAPGRLFSTVKDRLSLTRGGFRGRGRGGNIGRSPLIGRQNRGGFRGARGRGNLSRSQSNSNLSRSQSSSTLIRTPSTQSLNSRNISNGSAGRFRGRSQPRNRIGSQRSAALARQNFRRGRGGAPGSLNRNFRGGRRGAGAGKFNSRGQRPRGSGFRSRGPGRGRSRGRMGRDITKIPTKEELDDQLDQYMANTKVHLDKDLDNYMNQGGSDIL